MARLYIFAEGQTEQTFADAVLKPHLANHGVYLQKPVLIAHARRKGKAHRGGGRKYGPMRDDILRFTKQENGGDVFFSTMIDLYAIPPDFPSLDESERWRNEPYKRVEFLEEEFLREIGDPRFIPYIQLHEYEACLFSAPDAFAHFYGNREREIAELKGIADKVASPELIDDGPDTAPSKRITQVFPDYEGAKVTIGTQVAEKIGLNTIRGKCPHFDSWISRLEQLV